MRPPRGAGRADEGAYAVLYAALVVVLLGLSAMVVDFASTRQDRRALRSATDSAVVGAANLLNTRLGASQANPYNACRSAWTYLATMLRVTNAGLPGNGNACSPFAPGGAPIMISSYCAAASPAEIDAPFTIANRTYQVSWPIPKAGGAGYLNPDLAPGSVSQNFDPGIDGVANGTDKGCDRIGVAVFESKSFGLGGALSASGTQTQVHSVARVDVNGGPPTEVAALNVLNPTDCSTLVKTGGGKIIVGPTLDNGAIVGPGIIAVESDTSATGGPDNCNGVSTTAITTSGAGSSICASGTSLLVCDGNGVIESHSLDGANYSHAYSAGAGTISPLPTAEGGVHGYDPVTKLYGCNLTRLPCTPPTTNYVAQLEASYGGSGLPTRYTASHPPYADPYGAGFTNPGVAGATPGTFTSRTDFCTVSGTVVVPAGNWYASCGGAGISVTGTLVVQGGNLVSSGPITVANGGCFVMNTAVTGCLPTTTDSFGQTVFVTTGTGAGISTVTPPLHDATIFLRSGSITFNGKLAMPQTFVYAMGANGAALGGTSTVSPLWTAPGAGTVDGSGHTQLERDCMVGSTPDTDCMASRFARTAYWTDYAAPKTAPNTFNGQGNLAYVGVFFTPLGYDNFTGGTAGEAAAAQFWADKLNVNGGGTLVLSPDARFSFFNPTTRVRLIR